MLGEAVEKVGKTSVQTKASDPQGDVLIYNYIVSTGRVIGQGAKVFWDLSEATIGTHTITATIDDG